MKAIRPTVLAMEKMGMHSLIFYRLLAFPTVHMLSGKHGRCFRQ